MPDRVCGRTFTSESIAGSNRNLRLVFQTPRWGTSVTVGAGTNSALRAELH